MDKQFLFVLVLVLVLDLIISSTRTPPRMIDFMSVFCFPESALKIMSPRQQEEALFEAARQLANLACAPVVS